jgi:hypothetical protein
VPRAARASVPLGGLAGLGLGTVAIPDVGLTALTAIAVRWRPGRFHRRWNDRCNQTYSLGPRPGRWQGGLGLGGAIQRDQKARAHRSIPVAAWPQDSGKQRI